MNRTLHALEEKGIIERTRTDVDRRIVQVKLKRDNNIYLEQVHQKSLEIVDKMLSYWGAENAEKIIESLQLITQAAKRVVHDSGK